LNEAMQAHYAGDDGELKTFAAGVLAAYDGISVEEFEILAAAFLRSALHPTLGRDYLRCTYRPMVELLDYLTAQGFTTYIASGGGAISCGRSAPSSMALPVNA
jgi:hypothetical protein